MKSKLLVVLAALAVVSFAIAACGGSSSSAPAHGVTKTACTSASISGTLTPSIGADITYSTGTSDAITTAAGFGGSTSGTAVAPASGVTPQYSWTDPAATVVIQKLGSISGASTYAPVFIVNGTGGAMPASPYIQGKVPAGTSVSLATEPVLAAGQNYQLVVIRNDNSYDCKNFSVY